MPLTCCGACLFLPTKPFLPPIFPCSGSFCSLSFLSQIQTMAAECQITYGESTPLLLQLLVLQPFMEGVLLGVLSKVLVNDTVFPRASLIMLNFLIISTSSTPINCYENTQKLALLDMRGQLLHEDHVGLGAPDGG